MTDKKVVVQIAVMLERWVRGGFRLRNDRRKMRLVLFSAMLAIAVEASAETIGASNAAELPDSQTLAEKGEDIAPAEWRTLAAGRTVWYYDAQGLWGRERYSTDVDTVVFQFHDGQCLAARWSHDANLYCFDFGAGAPHCFRHLRYDGQLWVLGEQGTVQHVARIDDAMVDCGPSPMS